MSKMSTRLQGQYDRLLDALADMSSRDRSLLFGLFVSGTLAVVVGGAWWMHSGLEELETRIEARQMTLREIEVMAVQHLAAFEQVNEIEALLEKHASGGLSSFLEQAAQRVGIEDRLASVRERSTASDGVLEEKSYVVKLSRLTLQELSTFLWEVETAGYPLKIRTLNVKTKKKSGEKVIDVDMDVSAFRVLSEGDSEEG